MVNMESIDEKKVIAVIREYGPIMLSELLEKLGVQKLYEREMDRVLQRLRRRGDIRYQPKSPGSGYPKGGWIIPRWRVNPV